MAAKQDRRIKGAGLRVHRPATTASCIRDQDIDPAPFLDDTRDHRLDSLTVANVDLDPQRDATCRLDLSYVIFVSQFPPLRGQAVENGFLDPRATC